MLDPAGPGCFLSSLVSLTGRVLLAPLFHSWVRKKAGGRGLVICVDVPVTWHTG